MPDGSTLTGLLLTFSDAIEGQENAYDDWYQKVHLPQVCEIPGIRAAQRFRLVHTGAKAPDGPRNVAVYQLDGDPQLVFAEMLQRARSGALDRSDAVDQATISVTLWTANGDQVVASPTLSDDGHS
jgi:hypothetical protein